MPSLVHSVIITTAGVVIALRCNWQSPTILSDKDELVGAAAVQHVAGIFWASTAAVRTLHGPVLWLPELSAALQADAQVHGPVQAPAFIGLELGYLLQELVKEGDKQRRCALWQQCGPHEAAQLLAVHARPVCT